jgi:hypothetical protein
VIAVDRSGSAARAGRIGGYKIGGRHGYFDLGGVGGVKLTESRAAIAFAVPGWPPTKNEATSMLAAGHPHAARVQALLEAAQQAVQPIGWTPVAGEISLELVVRGPGRPPSDATNYLGGVGDVLQDKTVGHGLDLTHLGELGAVALYTDDRQIRQIHYTEEHAHQASYSIRIRRLDPAAPAAAAPAAPVATVEETATERGRRVVAALAAKGEELGFTVLHEYPVQGGRLDVVWLMPTLEALPGTTTAPPVVGFEVESSWRTRKHLKGDYLNLYDLGAALGVLVLLGDGPKVEATRRFAQTLVDRPGPRVLVWSEQDVEQLLSRPAVTQITALTATDESPASTASNGVQHVGKFRALWAWLRDQPGAELPVTFDEIEEVIGTPLPRSCRRHPAHWSSYEGSAVARAIQDAGWTATKVNLGQQRLVLVRRDRAPADHG